MSRRTAALALLSCLVCGVSGHAEDWPQWLGPQRDGVWREGGILETFPEKGPTVRWRTAIDAGYAGPAVAGGRVYVMDRQLAEGTKNPANPFQRGSIPGTERVLCLNETDGSVVWQHKYDCPYTASYPLGPRTTPLVRDGKVYTLGTEGNLLCLQAADGALLWAHEFKKEYSIKTPMWGFSAHPLLDGNKLVCMVGGKGTTVVAFDKDSGKEIWRALSAKETGYCPPMVYEAGGKRQLIIWDSDAVHGLDPENGKVYWTVALPTYAAMSISTPRKHGAHLFFTAYPNTALMLNLANDKPAVEQAWRGDKKLGLFSVFSAPAFNDEFIYGASSDGKLVCIKADTGERLWETMVPNNGKKAPSGDPFLVKNGARYFLFTEKGDLIIAKLSPKEYQEVGRAHLLEPTTTAFGREVVWSHPAFANRSMFARNDKEIICVSLAAPDK